MPDRSGQDEELERESIEAATTRPPMFLGLPRKLSSLLLALASICWILIDGWQQLIVAEIAILMLAGGLKPLVARDYWGFDIFLSWLFFTARCLDVRAWAGARLASFPLRSSRPYGMFADA
jgi:type IV secretory pathway VirB3-like protein